MFEINTVQRTVEYTVYKLRSATNFRTYLLECDGRAVGTYPTVEAAHKEAKAHAKTCNNKGAGLTEAFGRNRQYVVNDRFALVKFEGAE